MRAQRFRVHVGQLNGSRQRSERGQPARSQKPRRNLDADVVDEPRAEKRLYRLRAAFDEQSGDPLPSKPSERTAEIDQARGVRIDEHDFRTDFAQLYGVAAVAGIGFTMSLFIGTLAFADAAYSAGIRIGVLGGSLDVGAARLGGSGAGDSRPSLARRSVARDHGPLSGRAGRRCERGRASRRPRSAEDEPVWAGHVLAVTGDVVGGAQFETDRARFLGRGNQVHRAAAVEDLHPSDVADILEQIAPELAAELVEEGFRAEGLAPQPWTHRLVDVETYAETFTVVAVLDGGLAAWSGPLSQTQPVVDRGTVNLEATIIARHYGKAPPPLGAMPGLCLATSLEAETRPVFVPPIQPLLEASRVVAHNFAPIDADGPWRRYVPFIRHQGQVIPSLAVASAAVAMGVEGGDERLGVEAIRLRAIL